MQVSVYKNGEFVFTRECSGFVPSEEDRMVCKTFYDEFMSVGCKSNHTGFTCKREAVRKQTVF